MKCPACRLELAHAGEVPEVGQVSICPSCTQPMVWAGPIGWRKPTPLVAAAWETVLDFLYLTAWDEDRHLEVRELAEYTLDWPGGYE